MWFVFICKRRRSQCSSRQIPEHRVISTLKKDLNPRPRPFDITLDILGKHQISWSKGEKRTSVYVREMPMIPVCNVCMQCIWRHSTVTDGTRWTFLAKTMDVPLLLHQRLVIGKDIRDIENLTCICKITSRELKGSKEKKRLRLQKTCIIQFNSKCPNLWLQKRACKRFDGWLLHGFWPSHKVVSFFFHLY